MPYRLKTREELLATSWVDGYGAEGGYIYEGVSWAGHYINTIPGRMFDELQGRMFFTRESFEVLRAGSVADTWSINPEMLISTEIPVISTEISQTSIDVIPISTEIPAVSEVDNMWLGEGTPEVGQFIAPGLRIVSINRTTREYLVLNLSSTDRVSHAPNNQGNSRSWSWFSNRGIILNWVTGDIVRDNVSYPGRTGQPTTNVSPTTVPILSTTPPGIPVDSPYRIATHVLDSNSAFDPQSRFGIEYVPEDRDYVQFAYVQLISAPDIGYLRSIEGPTVTRYNPQEVQYSRAYGAYVRASNMTSNGTERITIWRENEGNYFYFVVGERVRIALVPGYTREYIPIEEFFTLYPNPNGNYSIESKYLIHLNPYNNTNPNFESTREISMPTTPNGVVMPSIPKKKAGRPTTEAKTRDVMLKLIETRTLKQAEDILQCGLEFEFHKLNDKERGEFDGELDETRLEVAIDAAVAARVVDSKEKSLLSVLVDQTSWRNVDVYEIVKGLNKAGLDLSVLTGEIATRVSGEVDYITRFLRNTMREQILSGGGRVAYVRNLGIHNWDAISNYTEMGDDGSVRGGELRTVGPRSVGEFLTVCEAIAATKFTVAENTSFHIHLSVKGIKHAYGQRFQAEMYAYLLRNIHRMPETVRKRMIHPGGGMRFAAMRVSTEKFSAIHFHKQGTWEFRLFGNMHNVAEMRTCLQLAYESLRHAYAVKLERSKSLLGNAPLDTIIRALDKSTKTLDKFAENLAGEGKYNIEPTAA